jgi:hypothetical protein
MSSELEMVKQYKHSLYLTYTDREAKAFSELPSLVELGLLPSNRNEVLRRGLLSCFNLARVDEYVLLEDIAAYLRAIAESDPDPAELEEDIRQLNALSHSALAVMIAKKGAIYGDTFATILSKIGKLNNLCETHLKSDSSKKKSLSPNITNLSREIESTIKTVFLGSD